MTQQFFARAMQMKHFFFIFVKYREITTAKTVTLYKNLHFFSLKVLKARKRS